jgi:hypothetical protein
MNRSTPYPPLDASRALAHEFNNFLTTCMTHAEVALESRSSEDMAEALQWILESAGRAAPICSASLQHELPFAAPPREDASE